MSEVKRKDLEEKCKALDIKFYGTKQQILDRISKRELELAKTNIESDNSLNLNLEEDDDDDFDDDPYEDEQDDQLNDVPLPSQDTNDNATNDNASNKSIASLDESYEKLDENSKKRHRIVSVFKLFMTYDTKLEASAFVKAENFWHKDRCRDTKEGIKEVFKCKYSGCNSKCYLLFESSR